jgi:hypothetical protein
MPIGKANEYVAVEASPARTPNLPARLISPPQEYSLEMKGTADDHPPGF